jgi:lipopolysaccharide/colanic/teichoic acid biosynthesis glycosyltransferase
MVSGAHDHRDAATQRSLALSLTTRTHTRSFSPRSASAAPLIEVGHNEVAQELPTVARASRLAMRVIDVVGAVVLLVVFSPVILVASVLVKTTSPGPVIFRQERVGRAGQHFTVLKFRTMADGTHDEVHADPEVLRLYRENDFKLPPDDPRITSIGRWLRKTSLDELPQLVNVLRGEMALVGVRPLKPEELALRSSFDQALYGLHRPALTGLWQVEGRSHVGGDTRVELDRRCLMERGVGSTIKILLLTPRVVLRGVGAH